MALAPVEEGAAAAQASAVVVDMLLLLLLACFPVMISLMLGSLIVIELLRLVVCIVDWLLIELVVRIMRGETMLLPPIIRIQPLAEMPKTELVKSCAGDFRETEGVQTAKSFFDFLEFQV